MENLENPDMSRDNVVTEILRSAYKAGTEDEDILAIIRRPDRGEGYLMFRVSKDIFMDYISYVDERMPIMGSNPFAPRPTMLGYRMMYDVHLPRNTAMLEKTGTAPDQEQENMENSYSGRFLTNVPARNNWHTHPGGQILLASVVKMRAFIKDLKIKYTRAQAYESATMCYYIEQILMDEENKLK